jgi:hypothetical protein
MWVITPDMKTEKESLLAKAYRLEDKAAALEARDTSYGAFFQAVIWYQEASRLREKAYKRG